MSQDFKKESLDLQLSIIRYQDRLIHEQADLIALLKAQLQAKEEGDVCI